MNFLPPSNESLRRDHVLAVDGLERELGERPFGGTALFIERRLPIEAAGTVLHDEAALLEFGERPRSGVLGDPAQLGRVTYTKRNAAVVLAVVKAVKLDKQDARRRLQRPIRGGPQQPVMKAHVLLVFDPAPPTLALGLVHAIRPP